MAFYYALWVSCWKRVKCIWSDKFHSKPLSDKKLTHSKCYLFWFSSVIKLRHWGEILSSHKTDRTSAQTSERNGLSLFTSDKNILFSSTCSMKCHFAFLLPFSIVQEARQPSPFLFSLETWLLQRSHWWKKLIMWSFQIWVCCIFYLLYMATF